MVYSGVRESRIKPTNWNYSFQCTFCYVSDNAYTNTLPHHHHTTTTHIFLHSLLFPVQSLCYKVILFLFKASIPVARVCSSFSLNDPFFPPSFLFALSLPVFPSRAFRYFCLCFLRDGPEPLSLDLNFSKVQGYQNLWVNSGLSSSQTPDF